MRLRGGARVAIHRRRRRRLGAAAGDRERDEADQQRDVTEEVVRLPELPALVFYRVFRLFFDALFEYLRQLVRQQHKRNHRVVKHNLIRCVNTHNAMRSSCQTNLMQQKRNDVVDRLRALGRNAILPPQQPQVRFNSHS